MGVVRALLSVQGSVNLPNSGVTLEQFSTTLLNFTNTLANGTLIHPIRTTRGFQIPNLDSVGRPFHLAVEGPSLLYCHSTPPYALPDEAAKFADHDGQGLESKSVIRDSDMHFMMRVLLCRTPTRSYTSCHSQCDNIR